MRQVDTPAGPVDAGPTVFTMRWVFEEIFAAAGTSLTSHIDLSPLPVLARHAWDRGPTLDLFADLEASVDAIGAFAGARGRGGIPAFRRAGAKDLCGAGRPISARATTRLGTRAGAPRGRCGNARDLRVFHAVAGSRAAFHRSAVCANYSRATAPIAAPRRIWRRQP